MKIRNALLIGLVFLALYAGYAGVVMAQPVTAPVISITLARYDPYPAQPGSYVNLWISVENQGGVDASNVTVELVPEYPFSLDPGVNPTNQIGKLSASDSVLLQYKIRVDENAVSGTNELKVRYQTSTGNTWAIETLDLYVLGKSKIDVSDVSTTTLEPGKPTEITFTLENAGGSMIRDLTFSWTQADDLILPVGSDNKMYINNLGIGEKTGVTFIMTTSPDTTPGVYPLTLTMSYADGNGTSTATSEIGFIVGGTTDFDISAEGSSGQVSLSIANIGANNADSVMVQIPDQQSYSATGASSTILGNLNRGDYTTATFQISSRIQRNATAGGGGFGQIPASNQSLLVRIYYTDTTGQRQSIEKQVSLPSGTFSGSSSTTTNTYSQRVQSNGQGLMYIIIGTVGIAALAGFFLYRQRKKKKK
jgi:hypothetical protein